MNQPMFEIHKIIDSLDEYEQSFWRSVKLRIYGKFFDMKNLADEISKEIWRVINVHESFDENNLQCQWEAYFIVETPIDFEEELRFLMEKLTKKKAKARIKKPSPKLGSEFENLENFEDTESSKILSYKEDSTKKVT